MLWVIMIIHLFKKKVMKNFFKKNKWFITLAVVLVGTFTGIDLTSAQKAVS